MFDLFFGERVQVATNTRLLHTSLSRCRNRIMGSGRCCFSKKEEYKTSSNLAPIYLCPATSRKLSSFIVGPRQYELLKWQTEVEILRFPA
mmetsp:Transcript_32779/g.68761  ORF Transcript_32779/g.68761 Transcript_32779/m.68761 type:complete len:90 (-) Transcript_32779:151-420(-)